MPRRIAAALAALMAALAAGPAAAHIVGPDHPLYPVLRHPAFELPIAAIAVALGIWAGQQAARAGWAMIAAFVLAVVAGALAAGNGMLPPWRAPAVALAMTGLGAFGAMRARVPLGLGAALSAAAGTYLGAFGTLAHWQGGTGPYAVSDLAVAALLVPLIATQLVQRFRAEAAQIAARVLASWVAASGILLLALALRVR